MKKKRWSQYMISFFALIAIIFIMFKLYPEERAKQSLKLLYTVEASERLGDIDSTALIALYQKQFANYMTESGITDAIRLRLPYGLLNRNVSVERTAINSTSLNKVDNLSSKERTCYLFKFQITTYYEDKSLETLCEFQEVEGTIYLKKTGILSWKLDSITIK